MPEQTKSKPTEINIINVWLNFVPFFSFHYKYKNKLSKFFFKANEINGNNKFAVSTQ